MPLARKPCSIGVQITLRSSQSVEICIATPGCGIIA